MGVQHGDPGRRQPGQGGGERRVERAGALRAAEDEQHGAVGGQAELLPGLGPQRRPVELGDRAPQRDAEDLRAGQAPGHGRRDARGEPGADPVGQARARVGLVHDDRHAAPGPEVGGQRDVAAEPDDDVGVDLREHLPHPADGRAHPTGQAQQVGAGLARERDGRDQLEGVAPRRDERGVQPAFRAQGGDGGGRVEPQHGVGQRQRGLDVARAAPARDDERDHRTPRAAAGRETGRYGSGGGSRSRRASLPCPWWRSAAMASGSWRAALASMPNTNMVTTNDVPPDEISGSVRPVTGSRPTTYAMLMAAWPTSQVADVATTSLSHGSETRVAMRRPA